MAGQQGLLEQAFGVRLVDRAKLKSLRVVSHARFDA